MSVKVIHLSAAELSRSDIPDVRDHPVFEITGPLTERERVDTAWGKAWAEVGTYIAKNIDTGDKHIVHPGDLGSTYRVID